MRKLTDSIRDAQRTSSLYTPTNILNNRLVPFLPRIQLAKVFPSEDFKGSSDLFPDQSFGRGDSRCFGYLNLEFTFPESEGEDLLDETWEIRFGYHILSRYS